MCCVVHLISSLLFFRELRLEFLCKYENINMKNTLNDVFDLLPDSILIQNVESRNNETEMMNETFKKKIQQGKEGFD
jgi:hypothetical protein